LPHSRQEDLPTKAPGTLNDLPDNQETIMKTLMTSSNLPRWITTAIFAALTLTCGAVSIAADNSDVPQAVVKFADLNLSNPQGAITLYSRIAAAANRVCKPFDIDSRDLGSRARLDSCVHKAIANAVTKVDHPELFAVYNAKNHQPRPIIVAAVQTR
jgi:UrcA family protein